MKRSIKPIEPCSTELNFGNAYWMAKIAKAAYLKNPDNSPNSDAILEELQAKDSGFMHVHSFSVDNAQAILVEHEQYLCMAFPGAGEFYDWLDNIKICRKKLDGNRCKVHGGFFEQLDAVWGEIEDKYNDINDGVEERPLFFTGHSLGGAVATLATARWVLDGNREFTSTYTFGQPRAITLEAYEILDSKLRDRFFRFQNGNDLIPHIPLIKMGYKHIGQIVYIDKDKNIHTDPSSWLRLRDKVFRIKGKVFGIIGAIIKKILGQFIDHRMDEYLEAVKNCATQ